MTVTELREILEGLEDRNYGNTPVVGKHMDSIYWVYPEYELDRPYIILTDEKPDETVHVN